MNNVTSICQACGLEFSYIFKQGHNRKYCQREECVLAGTTSQCRHCGCSITRSRKRYCSETCKEANRKARREAKPQCAVPDCSNPSSYKSAIGSICNGCYYRFRRTGTLERRECYKPRKRPQGYVVLVEPDHPMATKKGLVFEHRKVLYDYTNGQDQQCHWCGISLGWKELVVDHLNEIKWDNRPENLVPACSGCNMARGSMLPFAEKVRPEQIEEALQLLREYAERFHRDGLSARIWQRTCKRCGGTFCHEATSGSPIQFCSDACRKKQASESNILRIRRRRVKAKAEV